MPQIREPRGEIILLGSHLFPQAFSPLGQQVQIFLGGRRVNNQSWVENSSGACKTYPIPSTKYHENIQQLYLNVTTSKGLPESPSSHYSPASPSHHSMTFCWYTVLDISLSILFTIVYPIPRTVFSTEKVLSKYLLNLLSAC